MTTTAGRRRGGSAETFAWGALWGEVLGAWLLAVRLVAFYRIQPATASDWLHLDFALAVTFAVLGSLCGFFGAAPLVAWVALRGRPLRDPRLAHGIGAAAYVPLAYLATVVGIEAMSPALPAHLDPLGAVVVPATLVVLALTPALALAYRRAASRPAAAGRMALALGAAAAAGLLVLPLRMPVERLREAAENDPAPSVRGLSSTPLLFVAIDGANWRTLRPLLDRGALPTFFRLAAEGIAGEIQALWPPYWSTPAWAAILTGYPPNETGVHAELAGRIPGVPRFQVPLTFDLVLEPISVWALVMAQAGIAELTPAPRSELRRPPFWELLARAGLKTAVVRLSFTYPASGPASYVISDWVGHDEWSLLGMDPTSAPNAVWPPEEARRLLGLFSRPESPGAFAPLLAREARPKPRDARVNPVSVLRASLRIDQQALSAAKTLLRDHPDLTVVALYLGGFDTVCHAFWQYRFPGDFPEAPPDAADIEELRAVIDRYWAFLDGAVAELVAAFPKRPNVLVVADHGTEAIHDHSLWRGWHSGRGAVFLAAGPEVPRSAEPLLVRYFDVTPTILELMGLRTVPGMAGTPVFARH